ncbi:MAG: PglZ domain-containing protein, partial [Fibrobacterota bacterium]
EEEELMEKAIGRRIDGYLTKPVNPSQVLLVCKNLLNSDEYVSQRAKNLFVKSYSEIQTYLNRSLDYKGWVKLYHSLIKREINLSDIDDESIRQGHSAQYNEANKKFGDWMVSVFPKWISGEIEKPSLSPDILEKFLVPEIRSGKKVAFLVLDSIRMDQYITIQRVLKRNFQVNNYFYYSIIPTAKEFSMASLFTGLLPRDIQKQHGDIWDIMEKGGRVWEQLLKIGFSRNDLDADSLDFYDMHQRSVNINKVSSRIVKKDRCAALHADFLDLMGANNSSVALGEMAADGKAFRDMTAAWFRGSSLYELLRRFSSEEITVVVTPSSGNVFSTRGTEYYGNETRLQSGRFRYGENITCDERYGYLLTEPYRFGLPVRNEDSLYICLKENFYFKEHASYRKYNSLYKNSFERGGISLDEVIMPISVLKPKVLDLDLDF